MNLSKADQFLADAEQQFRWYLTESGLDDIPALELAERFQGAVEASLEFLAQNPFLGRVRFVRFSDLPRFRSWKVEPPFQRFLIFYRMDDQTLFIERLLDGHRSLLSENN